MTTVELTLTGPDGANPLGFLCALGTLRTLSNAWPDSEVKMKWKQIGAAWRPVLRASHADLDGKDEAGQKDVIVNAILAELGRTEGHPMMKWGRSHDNPAADYRTNELRDARSGKAGGSHDNPAADYRTNELRDARSGKAGRSHDIPAADYRTYASDAIKSLFNQSDHRPAEWAAALACDQITDEKGNVKYTAFRTMSGQGRQYFLRQMHLLQQSVEAQHIAEALFEWRYQDEQLNLRFEPFEDRRHALRWKSPDEDTIKTVWGANRLAAEGLPLYPVFPVHGELRTVGFRGFSKDNTFWTWPLWNVFLNVSVVRSILALPALQAEQPSRDELLPLGIVEVYRTQRINVGKFRAFTPAQAI